MPREDQAEPLPSLSQARPSLLASIVESSEDGILSIALDGSIISWNPAAEHIFGWSAEEIVGLNISLIIPEDKMDELPMILEKISSNERLSQYETVRMDRNGGLIPVSLTISPIYDAAGEIIGGSTIIRDITEISNWDHIFRGILESYPDAMVISDVSGTIVIVNAQTEKLFGYNRKDIIGQPVEFLMPSRFHAKHPSERENFVANSKVRRMGTGSDFLGRRKDGIEIPIDISLSPIETTEGAFIVASIRDISEQRKAAQYARSLIEASPDPLVTISHEGKILDINEAMARVTGFGREQLIGTDISDYFTEPEKARAGYERVFAEAVVTDYPLTLRAIDGQLIDVLYYGSVYKDTQGNALGVVAAARDITKQKKAAEHTKKLAAIVESSVDAILTTDIDAVIESWNPAAEQIFGYMAEEVIGQNVSVIIPPENAEEESAITGKISNNERIGQYETVRVGKDGRRISVSLTISPILDSKGAIIGASSIARDITEQKKREQYILELATIVETTDDAIWSTTPPGIFKSWNSAAERIFGYSAAEIVGQSVHLLLPSESKDEIEFINSRIEHGQILSRYETIRMSKDGRAIPVALTISPLHNNKGEVIGRSIIARDITEQKLLLQELNDANSLRNEFVAMVAHDIRSPAASISGFAHLLLDKWATTPDERKVDHLKVIARNTEHLAAFIEDVLQVARIETGEFCFNFHEFDIRDLVQKALTEIAGPEATKQIHFIAPDEIPLVMGDEERQWQVLINLLSNAVKFSPSGAAITVRISVLDESVEVALTDHGIGISREDLPKLFQKFGRVAQPPGKKVPGNGLGLYICKILVEGQGGTIKCESAPGKGSTFTYTIPKSQMKKTSLPKVQILHLDGDSDMVMLFKSTVSADPRVELSWEMSSAEEALNTARELNPDLVILGHKLDGEIMGLEAAPMLKSVFPDARIILFSTQDLSLEASQEPAIDLFLSKKNLSNLLVSVQHLMKLETPTAQ